MYLYAEKTSVGVSLTWMLAWMGNWALSVCEESWEILVIFCWIFLINIPCCLLMFAPFTLLRFPGALISLASKFSFEAVCFVRDGTCLEPLAIG